jgi:hypothetical protein
VAFTPNPHGGLYNILYIKKSPLGDLRVLTKKRLLRQPHYCLFLHG